MHERRQLRSDGTENVGIGNLALLSVASGGNNVPIGYAAAVSLTLRIGNFALGSQALANNIDANANVAIGYLALNGLTGGSGANIAVGQQAGYQLSTGANNVLFGTGAGACITTGSNNIIIGPLGGFVLDAREHRHHCAWRHRADAY